jgi:hypothetical protein
MWRDARALLLGVVTLASVYAVAAGWLGAQESPANPLAAELLGTRTWEWVDSSRTMPVGDGTHRPRRLMVQAWYPAADSGTEGRAPRLPEWDRLRDDVSPSVLGHLSAPTASYLNAPLRPPEAGPTPVLLLSHGLSQRRTDYLLTAEALARRGFIVVGVDHPGGAAAVGWADGTVTGIDPAWDTMSPPNTTIEEYHAFSEDRIAEWARDLRFVMSRWPAVALNGVPLPATSTIVWGVFGHSVGGKTAAYLCATEPSVRACANLDGWPVHASVEVRGLDQPYLHLEDLRDASEEEFRDWNSSLLEYTRTWTA